MVVTQYTQCGVSGAGVSFFVISAVEKALLLLSCALMAFTTRKVSSTFNESAGMALAIYNVCFSIGIVAPIILVIAAVGDVLTLLELFLLLWVSTFTAGCLILPKLQLIRAQQQQGGEQGQSLNQSSSSGTGYSFMSLHALGSVPALMAYISALNTHLHQAESRLLALKQGQQKQQMQASKPAVPNSPAVSSLSQAGRRTVISTVAPTVGSSAVEPQLAEDSPTGGQLQSRVWSSQSAGSSPYSPAAGSLLAPTRKSVVVQQSPQQQVRSSAITPSSRASDLVVQQTAVPSTPEEAMPNSSETEVE